MQSKYETRVRIPIQLHQPGTFWTSWRKRHGYIAHGVGPGPCFTTEISCCRKLSLPLVKVLSTALCHSNNTGHWSYFHWILPTRYGERWEQYPMTSCKMKMLVVWFHISTTHLEMRLVLIATYLKWAVLYIWNIKVCIIPNILRRSADTLKLPVHKAEINQPISTLDIIPAGHPLLNKCHWMWQNLKL